MADFAIWGEALTRALGYKENEFLKAYYNNIGFQNNEVIEFNPLAFAIKKLVEYASETMIIFEGTPSELLERLNQIFIDEKINTADRGWPKDRKWVVKRINTIKSNLQKGLGIKISIDRNTKNNTFIIKIEKNISGEHKLSPENESLSPYFDSLTPVSDELSPEVKEDLSTKSNSSGDTGHTGDKSIYVIEDKYKEDNNHSDSNICKNCNCQKPADHRIRHNHPFYYCIEHPKFINIHLETIEQHFKFSNDHTLVANR